MTVVQSRRSLLALKLCVLLTLVVGVLAVAVAPDRRPVEAGEASAFTIEPATPTEADSITISYEGRLPTVCYDVSSSHTRSEDLIRIRVDAASKGNCMLMLGSFSVTEEIGSLPAGSYQVIVTVYEPYAPFSCTLPPCSATTTFAVGPLPVGGIAQLPEVAGTSLESGGSSGPRAGVLVGIAGALAAGVAALGGAAWYMRGRWVT